MSEKTYNISKIQHENPHPILTSYGLFEIFENLKIPKGKKDMLKFRFFLNFGQTLVKLLIQKILVLLNNYSRILVLLNNYFSFFEFWSNYGQIVAKLCTNFLFKKY